MNLQQQHEKLLAWATAEPRKDDLLAARKAHFDSVGEPHEEDRSFEVRQNAMLDFYLYDWRPEGRSGTTLERFLEAEGSALAPEDLTGTAVFLASEDSDLMTGQVLVVDAGMIMLG